MRYRWPGNVRELESVIEWAVILAESGILDVRPGQAEYDLIVEALKRHWDNMTETAAHLGLHIARHNLNDKVFC
ncbi:hypothetical protein GCM10027514_25940 [Azotobacter armeniacus]